MKKIKYLSFILLMLFVGMINVSAKNLSCNYKSGSQKITISGTNTKCTITYPGGGKKNLPKKACKELSSKSCPDIFYNSNTKDMKIATSNYNNVLMNSNTYDSEMYSFLCANDKDKIKYFCTGTCKYKGNKKIDCDAIVKNREHEKALDTNLPVFCEQKGVLNAFSFIGKLLFIVKILVPILLIIMGSIDFGKAMISYNKQSPIQTAAKMFAFRIVAGIAIFVLPTIVNFIFDLLPTTTNSFENCQICLFHPNDCPND